MTLGKNIKQYRELKNITQEHMANCLEISQPTYAKIESGQITPKIERLQQISKILEVDLSTLLNTSNNLTFNFQKEAYYSGHIINQHIELKETFEKLIAAKDEQIALLKSMLEKNKK